MQTLNELRTEIDSIDEKLQLLLNERATVAKKIGEVKTAMQSDIRQPDREKEILDNIFHRNNGPLSNEALIQIFQEIINACRKIQTTQKP